MPAEAGPRFRPEKGKQLVDFLRRMECEGWPRIDS
jgi:hypothetical protein